MKLLKISPNGKMFQLGDDPRTATWYHLSEQISGNGYKIGDSVDFKWEKRAGTKYLTDIQKGVASAKNTSTDTYSDPSVKVSAPKPVVPKPTQEGGSGVLEPIVSSVVNVKAEIGKMTAETLIALQGKVTPENIEVLIDKIYNKYSEKVNS